MSAPDHSEGSSPEMPRNSALTIARILAGAEAEFGTKGLDGGKIEDIARAAGISKQLIYHYFSGKDELYGEMLAAIAQRNYEKLLAPDYDGLAPLNAVRAFFELLFDIYRSDPFSATVTVDQGLHGGAQVRHNRRVGQLREMLRDRLDHVIARGRAADEIAPDLTASSLHFLAVVMVTGSLSLAPMFLRYTGDKPYEEFEENARWRTSLADFFLRGVRADPERPMSETHSREDI
jgi:AcrR family transcriptional regulator